MNKPPSTQPFSVSFRTYSSEEIKKLSVKEITNPQFFTDIGSPYPGGLYDPALGPSEKNDVCSTCLLSPLHCPGHLGHVTLPLPVFNPLYIRLTVQLLHGSCLKCHHLAAPQVASHIFLCKLKLINSGRIDLLDNLNEDILKEHVANRDIRSIQDETESEEEGDTDDTEDLLQATLGESLDLSEPVCSTSDRCIAAFRNELISDFIRDYVRKRGKKCRLCEAPLHSVKLENNVRILTKGFDNGKPVMVTISAQDARNHLREIYLSDKRIISKLYGMFNNYEKCHEKDSSAVDQLFLEVLPISPARFRPLSGGSFDMSMNSESLSLAKVIQICIGLRELIRAINKPDKEGETIASASKKGPSLYEKLQKSWYELQMAVNSIVDSDLDKLDKIGLKKGIKQLLERKEGIFRKFMMGKRVNYAARSVISPDPYINSDEIGIPEIIAKKLTYPEPVTGRNVQELRQAVKNGPNVHPGAVAVEITPGKVVRLNPINQTSRDAMANRLLAPGDVGDEFSAQKKVLRHIRTGDVVLLNRQPTLHKPSIMAHKVRILSGEKTLRLHYSACKTYNADFDGDEMNVHFPQNEMGRAEATMIANTCDQYLVPKDGTPLGGLIQDHMVAGVHMTIRGRFFTREEYQQLVFAALVYKDDTVELLPPAMLKPALLWSGKQVISTVIRNIIPKSKNLLNFKGSTKVNLKSWIKSKPRDCQIGGLVVGKDMSEAEVVIRDGELLCGILDKENYGPTPYGMVHCCYELYGGHVGVLLLSCLGRLFTAFLQQISGFSLGVKDIIVLPGADEERQIIIQQAPRLGEEAIAEALELELTEKKEVTTGYGEAHREPGGKRIADIERTVKVATDKLSEDVREVCLPKGLLMKFPENNLQTMIVSGAKGSQVNALQISCLLGQIELEGRRPPLMTSGKSLPSFQSYDSSLRAGGYVAGRFLTGIRPQEYFFHCMAGREGLIDTAVKTSRSGYLQRCIIKHLEGLIVNYDLTVRDSDSSIIQFSYGEDGLDISRTPFLKREFFQFFMDNESVDQYRVTMDKPPEHLNSERAEKMFKQVRKWKRRNEDRERYCSGFVKFSEGRMQPLIKKIHEDDMELSMATCYNKARETLVKMWRKCSDKASHEKPFSTCPDPPQCQLNPSQNFGAVSERMNAIIENYLRDFQESPSTNKENLWHKENFKQMIYQKYRRSLCDPGEAVGLLAAQSIGEPSTQMTLNTFHFAGRGEMNVTLGIPRLREILLVASKDLKTPGMTVPVLQTKKAAKKINKLCKKLSKVFLSSVLEDMNVLESFQISKDDHHRRVYKVHLRILPSEYATTGVSLSTSQVLKHIETKFLEKLFSVIKMRLRELQRIRTTDSKTSVLDFLPDKSQASKDTDKDEEDEEGDMMMNTQSDGEDEETGTGEEAKIKRGEEDEYDEEDAEEQKEEAQPDDDQMNEGMEGTKGEPDEEPGEVKETDQQEEVAPLEESINLKRSSSSAKMKISNKDKAGRIQSVVESYSLLLDYDFDQEEEQWCELTIGIELMNSGRPDITSIVSELARQSVVYQASGIERCIVAENNGVKLLQTEGVNLKQLHFFENILDLKKLYTNDIHAMAATYGIEAAAHVLIKEIQGVFAVYGIAVDLRHLSLIADYMTFDGFYKPFNRRGLDSNPSTLQRMTFESSLQVLREATVQGTHDSLQSPSARLVLGRVVAGGTGCFDVLPQVF